MAEPIALSKTLDPADFALLAPELTVVDEHFASDRPQHEMRRWEYALALRAAYQWMTGRDYRYPRAVADIGGAGSPFRLMLGAQARSHVEVIDPDLNYPLAHYLTAVDTEPQLFDLVTCLSVLEHVDELDRFCYHLGCLVAPGGLLFLTMDYCDDPSYTEPEDHYHFSWMRKRIFNAETLGRIESAFYGRDFSHFGAIDDAYHGPQVYDYTFASLALVKRS